MEWARGGKDGTRKHLLNQVSPGLHLPFWVYLPLIHTLPVRADSCHKPPSCSVVQEAGSHSSLTHWLLSRSCQGRCWLETGIQEESGDRLVLFPLIPSSLPLCFDLYLCTKGNSLSQADLYSGHAHCSQCQCFLYPWSSLCFSYSFEKNPRDSPLLP